MEKEEKILCDYCYKPIVEENKKIEIKRAYLDYDLDVIDAGVEILHEECYQKILKKSQREYERGVLYGDMLYDGDLYLLDLELKSLGYPENERKEIVQYIKNKDEYRDEMLVAAYFSVYFDKHPETSGVLHPDRLKKIIEEFRKTNSNSSISSNN